MNPFDIKSALLAKHAQHVVLIHFPIALFLTGVAFDFVAYWTKRATFAAAAYVNLLVAAASVPVVVLTGILAWQLQLGGQKMRGVLLLHLISGCLSGALICVIAWIHWGARRNPGHAAPKYRFGLELVASLVVTTTGHLGGFLSGVNLSG
jgi:uncharacterized membrane protein